MAQQIECPNCGHHFDIEEVIQHHAEEKIRREFAAKFQEQAKSVQELKQQLELEKSEFEQKKVKENALFAERLEQRMGEERVKMAARLMEEQGQKMKMLESEMADKKKENLELKQKEVDLLRMKQNLQDEKEALKLQVEKEMFEKRKAIEEEIKLKEAEKFDLVRREYEKKLEDQKKLVDEMQRKASQGSMQLQGEILELALEEELRHAFPHDIIEEIGKGIRGADAVQTVVNPWRQVCGKIIFESKRTKAFSESWIEKLKEDQREMGASFAVLVTEVMPRDMDRFGMKDGIWICSFHEMRALVFVLREMLLREFSLRSAEENKGDKMSLLYQYLTGTEFRSRVEAIVEGFTLLKSDLDREKRAMQKIWKEREKQLEKVIGNTIDMHASIRGIAGKAIAPVRALELLPGEGEPEDQD